MAVASLVLSIVALIIAIFAPYIGWLAILLGVAGIVLGALGKKDPNKSGMATAGLVMSIIAVALSSILWIACALCVSAAEADLYRAAADIASYGF